jgi:hypothetical protein
MSLVNLQRIKATILWYAPINQSGMVAYALTQSIHTDTVHAAIQAAVLGGDNQMLANQIAAREGFFTINFRWHLDPQTYATTALQLNKDRKEIAKELMIRVGQTVGIALVRKHYIERAIAYPWTGE